jgi:hypothetical protein
MTMKSKAPLGELALSLQEARRRNPDAYSIIGAVSGYGERRIKEIARGAEPTIQEKTILESLARG